MLRPLPRVTTLQFVSLDVDSLKFSEAFEETFVKPYFCSGLQNWSIYK